MTGHPLYLVRPPHVEDRTSPAERRPAAEHLPVNDGGRRVGPTAVNTLLTQLRGDQDPLVVFTQLTELCVPLICDEATVNMSVGENRVATTSAENASRRASRASVTHRRLHVDPAKFSVSVQIADGTDAHDSPYLATLSCAWWLHEPTTDDVAMMMLLGRAAAGAVTHTRLAAAIAREHRRVENLRRALDSNRAVGAAIGILMARRQLTYEQAFTLLSTTSQHLNQKISGVAADVLYIGDLPT